MSNKSDSMIKLLIDKGQAQDGLTFTQINDELPSDPDSEYTIENVHQILNAVDIQIVEKLPVRMNVNY